MNRGDKFSVTGLLDVEILGFYPAGEQKDGKAKYVCTINGYKAILETDFIDMLKSIKENKKGETKNGRRKRNA